MKSLYNTVALKIMDKFLVPEKALSNKYYKERFLQKLESDMRKKYDGKHFDLWYKRMWDSLSYSSGRGHTPGTVTHLVELGLRLVNDNGLKSMCGIQPMNGPVGLIYTLNYREMDPDDDNIQTDKSKRMCLEVISSSVEAQGRRYATRWPLIPVEDNKALQESGLIPDMMEMTTESMSAEWINIFTENVVANSESTSVSLSKSSFDRGDWLFPLITKINMVAHQIGVNTRRGNGNVLWAPKHITEMLKDGVHIVESSADPSLSTSTIEHVGLLANGINVYTNHAAADSKIIMGYKGASESDSGVIFAPYVPVMSVGPVMNSKTFQPELCFMTRNGFYDHDRDERNNEIEAKHRYGYYHVIDVEFPGDNRVELLQEAA